MIFIIKTRPLTEKDLTASNHLLPELDDYDMYLRALSENLTQTDGIIDVTQDNSSLCIETKEPLSEEAFKKLIKTAFTEDIMNNLRFVSLV